MNATVPSRARGSRPRGMRFRTVPAAAAILLAFASAAGALPPPTQWKPAGRLRVELRVEASNAIRGEYVVAFGNGAAGPGLYAPSLAPAAAAAAVAASEAAEGRIEERRDESVVLARYRTAIVGFSARLTRAAVDDLRRTPGVRIEPNRVVPAPRDGLADPNYILPLLQPTVRPSHPTAFRMAAVAVAPRGLDRIDQRHLPLDGNYRPRSNGSGVHVYVMDTGVFAGHSEFGGRVLSSEGPGLGYNATLDGKGTGDCRDHGTGVASVIGGKTLGVAPGVIIHPVRVFPCTGPNASTATMIAGVDWVAKDRLSALASSPVVVNVSFKANTSKTSGLLDQAIANSVTVGRIPYVIAAGNDSRDACKSSPALVGPAITVGNIKSENDRRMVDSNWGKCVDLFAPGVNIPAASVAGSSIRANRNGTSFAAPHVTGVAALYLGKNPAARPAAVWAAILAAANNNEPGAGTPFWCGIPNRLAGSPNILLHWGGGSDDGTVDRPKPASAPAPPSC